MPILQLRKLSLKIEHTSRNCPTLGRDVILMDEKMEAQRGEVSSLDHKAGECQDTILTPWGPAQPSLLTLPLSCSAEPHLTLALLCPKSG